MPKKGLPSWLLLVMMVEGKGRVFDGGVWRGRGRKRCWRLLLSARTAASGGCLRPDQCQHAAGPDPHASANGATRARSAAMRARCAPSARAAHLDVLHQRLDQVALLQDAHRLPEAADAGKDELGGARDV